MVIDPLTICFKYGSISPSSIIRAGALYMEQAMSCFLESWTGLCRPQMDEQRLHPFQTPRFPQVKRLGERAQNVLIWLSTQTASANIFAWTTLLVPFGVGVRKDYGDLLSRLFNRHANGFPACESTQLHQDSLFTHCADLSVGFTHRSISVVAEGLNLHHEVFQYIPNSLWADEWLSCDRIHNAVLILM